LLKSGLYALLRFYTITNLSVPGTYPQFTSTILLCFGLTSLVLAVPFILKPNRFKRVLAYHSLAHMGIIVFGISIGSTLALFGALLHALNHALAKALMFLAYDNAARGYSLARDAGRYVAGQVTGVLTAMPYTGFALLMGGLALVGAPPFSIFFSELIILLAAYGRVIQPATNSDQSLEWLFIFLVALFVASLALTFAGLVRHLSRLLLGPPPAELEWPSGAGNESQAVEAEGVAPRDTVPLARTDRSTLPLLVLLAAILVMGLWLPFGLPELLARSVCIVQQGASSACN
jgi:hydrogenase-4 component F